MEVALKLYLQGLEVSFAVPDSLPRADLTVLLDRNSIHVEVSTLNSTDEETYVQLLGNWVSMAAFEADVAAGGIVNRAPSLEKLKAVQEGVLQAIARTKQSSAMEKLSYEGLATLYFAPRDMVDRMPPDVRRRFAFKLPAYRPVDERVQTKIWAKREQLLAQTGPAFLVLYTQTADTEAGLVRRLARHVVGAKQREFEELRRSSVDWVAVRPPFVSDGPVTRVYRIGLECPPGRRIARADVAHLMLHQALDDAYVRKGPFVAY